MLYGIILTAVLVFIDRLSKIWAAEYLIGKGTITVIPGIFRFDLCGKYRGSIQYVKRKNYCAYRHNLFCAVLFGLLDIYKKVWYKT